MKPSDCVACQNFPCVDVKHWRYQIPAVELDPERVRLVLISECAAENPADDTYAGAAASFAQTTLLAFQDAGFPAASIDDLLDRGIYLTPAVKCAKTAYGIETSTVNECSHLLAQELDLFPNLQVILLMGDVAIKAVNAIARRREGKRAIPAGATYKIRGGEFTFGGVRAFPSYLQVGPSFNIEKSKRRMIAEDIAAAMVLIKES